MFFPVEQEGSEIDCTEDIQVEDGGVGENILHSCILVSRLCVFSNSWTLN